MTIIKRFFKKLFIFLLLVIVVLSIICIYPLMLTSDSKGTNTNMQWMSFVPDNVLLNEISIPGTHNSGTEYVQLPFFSKCQGMDIKEQLESGFRLLDIRLGEEITDQGIRLKLMHGYTTCQKGKSFHAEALYLEDALNSCYTFLNEHPSESILFMVKHEHGDMGDEEFENVLFTYLMRDPDIWLLSGRIPNMGECRGKIVLLRRYGSSNEGDMKGLPFVWEDQKGTKNIIESTAKENNGFLDLYVQDRYEYNTDDKWNAFVNGMNNAAAEIENGAVSLNYLSTKGSLPVGHPYYYASKLNGYFRNRCEYIKGWVMFDFGEPYLAKMVYSQNIFMGQ